MTHLRLVLCLLLTVPYFVTPAQAGSVAFTESYLGAKGSATCATPFDIIGVAPDDGLAHPVFVYAVGTTEHYDNRQARAAIDAMAAKGFVAARVQYDSEMFGNCARIAQKAACIFKASSSDSAISKLCARGDCSKGVVVGGFSQGAIIATLARNSDARVQAAYGMGALSTYGVGSVARCMNDRKHQLPATRLRIVNGEKDGFGGRNANSVRSNSVAVTGKRCAANAYTCLNANGSGWIMVKDAQVSDKSADHCYQRKVLDCNGSENVLDPKWKSGGQSWALPANLAWLKTFTKP